MTSQNDRWKSWYTVERHNRSTSSASCNIRHSFQDNLAKAGLISAIYISGIRISRIRHSVSLTRPQSKNSWTNANTSVLQPNEQISPCADFRVVIDIRDDSIFSRTYFHVHQT